MIVDPRAPAPETAYDASDPEQIKRAEAAATLREEERRQVASAILATPQGREWLWQVLRDTGFLEAQIAMTAGQYEQGFFNGKREIGLSFMRVLCRAHPDDFAKMIKENDNRG